MKFNISISKILVFLFISLPVIGGMTMCIGFLFYELIIENILVGIAYLATWALLGKEIAWAASLDLYSPALAYTFYVLWAGLMFYLLILKENEGSFFERTACIWQKD
jgi:hypothetical protein